jgi:uncharacterized protein (DUF1697 family)
MKFVAFLRAINVGGHTVKMDHLRNLFESMGFTNVETLIASGNVVFDSKSKNAGALEKTIEKQLRQALGYDVTTFIRTIPEVADVTRYQCFDQSELDKPGNVLYVGFMSATPSPAAIKKLATLADKVNDFNVHQREVYWLRRTSAGESEYSGGLIEKTLGVPVTFRNITTVKKVATKYLH